MMKPREKALSCGLFSLTDEELLALVLETGGKKSDVLSLSKQTMDKYHGLSSILFEYEGLVHGNGIGQVKRLRLMTSLEFIRRFSLMTIGKINSCQDCFLQTRTFFYKRKKEALLIFLLSRDGKVKHIVRKDSGFYDKIQFPYEIFDHLPVLAGDGMLFVHNHPSGNPQFSEADMSCYHRLCQILIEKKARMVGFMVLGSENYSYMSGFFAKKAEISGK